MKGKNQMRKSLGFTLAEVLITLAIIGVVAAMTIPSVIINTNQQEYKTGLKKAVSVLNQAITMNMALENMSPADTVTNPEADKGQVTLQQYLAQRLNVIKSTSQLDFNNSNAAFYTSDGMRYEFPKTAPTISTGGTNLAACTKAEPCLILVDVNGDRKPNPLSTTTQVDYDIVKAGADGKVTKINDLFAVLITDTAAIPYGVVAQTTMFQAD